MVHFTASDNVLTKGFDCHLYRESVILKKLSRSLRLTKVLKIHKNFFAILGFAKPKPVQMENKDVEVQIAESLESWTVRGLI